MTTREECGSIYQAYCLVTGKSYIGLTTKPLAERIRSHVKHIRHGDSSHFYNAIRKHGIEKFVWRILVDGLPRSQLVTQERFWIRFYDTFQNGYNSTSGGDGGYVRSAESRQKMSESKRGKKASAETRRKMSEAHRGKKKKRVKSYSAEYLQKMSNTHLRLNAKMRLEARQDAGQQFLFDMELEGE